MIPAHLVEYDVSAVSNEINLQTLRREIIQERDMQNTLFDVDKPVELANKKYGKHEKYGTGIIIKEDENIITINFDGYGEKEFLKAFGEIEIL